MHFGFALDLSDIDLLNIDLLDQRYTHLDLLDTDIPSKHFVCFPDVSKTSSRHLQDMSSRHVCWDEKSLTLLEVRSLGKTI